MDFIAWRAIFHDPLELSSKADDPAVLQRIFCVAELGCALLAAATEAPLSYDAASSLSGSAGAQTAQVDPPRASLEDHLCRAARALSRGPVLSCDDVRLALLWLVARELHGSTTTGPAAARARDLLLHRTGSASSSASAATSRRGSTALGAEGGSSSPLTGTHSSIAQGQGSAESRRRTEVEAVNTVGCFCSGRAGKKRAPGASSSSSSSSSAAVAPEPAKADSQQSMPSQAGPPRAQASSQASASSASVQSLGTVAAPAASTSAAVSRSTDRPPPLVQQGTDDPVAVPETGRTAELVNPHKEVFIPASESATGGADGDAGVEFPPVRLPSCSFGRLLEYVARGASAAVTYSVLGAPAALSTTRLLSPGSSSSLMKRLLPAALDEVLQAVESGRLRRPAVGPAPAAEIVKLISSDSLQHSVTSNVCGLTFAALAQWASSCASSTAAAEAAGQAQHSCMHKLRQVLQGLRPLKDEPVHVACMLGMLQGARSTAALLTVRPQLPRVLSREVGRKSIDACAPIIASVCNCMGQTLSAPLGAAMPSYMAVASHSLPLSACIASVLQCLWKGDPAMAPPEGGLSLSTIWTVLQAFQLIPTPESGVGSEQQQHGAGGVPSALSQLSFALSVLDGRALSLALPSIIRAVVDTGRLLVTDVASAQAGHTQLGAAAASLSSATRLRFAVDRQWPLESVLQAVTDLDAKARGAGGAGAGEAPLFGNATILHPLFASVAPASSSLVVEAGEGHGPRKELLYLACLQATGHLVGRPGEEGTAAPTDAATAAPAAAAASSTAFLRWNRDSSSHCARRAGTRGEGEGEGAPYAFGWLLASSSLLNGVHMPPGVLKCHPATLLPCVTAGRGPGGAGLGLKGAGAAGGGHREALTVAHLLEYDPSMLRTLQNIHELAWPGTLDMLETEELCLWMAPESCIIAPPPDTATAGSARYSARPPPRIRDCTDGALVSVGLSPSGVHSSFSVPIDLRMQEPSADLLALLHKLYTQRLAAHTMGLAHGTDEGRTVQALCAGLQQAVGHSVLSSLLVCPRAMLPLSVTASARSVQTTTQGTCTMTHTAAGGLGLSLYDVSCLVSACDDASWAHAMPWAAALGARSGFEEGTDESGANNVFLVPGWFRVSPDPELSACTPLLLALWTVLASLSNTQQRAVLAFLTGLPSPPVYGTEFLRLTVPYTPLTRGEKAALLHRLPAAHTCHNTLEFPNYYSALKSTFSVPGSANPPAAQGMELPEELKAPLPDALRAALEHAVAYWHSGPSAGGRVGGAIGTGLVSSVILPADKAVTQATLLADPFFLACVRIWSERLATAVSGCVGYALDSVLTDGLLAPAPVPAPVPAAGTGKRVGIAPPEGPGAAVAGPGRGTLVKRGTADVTTTALLHAVAKRLSDPHIEHENLSGGAVPRAGQAEAGEQDSDDEFLRSTRKQR